MGHIYLITCSITNKQYVGQTCNSIEIRWKNHKNIAKRLKRSYDEKDINFEGISTYLYRSMVKHGIDNFSIKSIIEIPNENLDEHEIKFIKEYNTLRPFGYNLTTGGGHFKHHETTKQLMREKAIEAAPALIDKYRKEATKGLPMYIISHNKGTSKGFAINCHPLCKYKSFTTKKYDTLEACKIAACGFLKELNENKNEYTHKKKADETLPLGITRFRNGYKFQRKINDVIYRKTFEGVKLSDEEKLNTAIAYSQYVYNK